MPITILFVSTMGSSPWGGSEELWSAAAERLAKKGYSVSASVAEWPQLAPKLKQLVAKGVRVTMRHSQSLATRAVRRILNAPRNLYREAIMAASPDLIVISNGTSWPPIEAVTASMQAGVPYINIAQANHIDWFPSADEAEILRFYFAAAKACWFVSEANRRLTETQIGASLQRAIVVRNPFFAPYDAKISWTATNDNKGFRFACVGRLHAPSKGQDILLEVLSSEVWKARNWTLSLFGEGPHRETLQRLVRLHEIEDRVHFCGYVSDIVKIWREHHIHLLASRYEGLPLSSVEAMLCGRVVVATDVAGNREIIEDGVSGFLADAPTARHFHEALDRAWAVRHEWRLYGQHAAQRVRAIVPEDPVKEVMAYIGAALGTEVRCQDIPVNLV